MKVIDKIVIHSARENEDRDMISKWCSNTFQKHTWYMNSDYREEGCFKLTFASEKDASLYLLKWGGFVIDIIYKAEEVFRIDNEVFNSIFEVA